MKDDGVRAVVVEEAVGQHGLGAPGRARPYSDDEKPISVTQIGRLPAMSRTSRQSVPMLRVLTTERG